MVSVALHPSSRRPHGHAVTVGCKHSNFCLARTCTLPIQYARRRTGCGSAAPSPSCSLSLTGSMVNYFIPIIFLCVFASLRKESSGLAPLAPLAFYFLLVFGWCQKSFTHFPCSQQDSLCLKGVVGLVMGLGRGQTWKIRLKT